MVSINEDKVSLREFEEKDIENKVNWINDERNNRYLHYDIPLTVEKTYGWFKNKEENRLDCVILYNDIPVGLVGLIGIDKANQKAEFYISMGRDDFKQKGIATTATRLILGYAFDKLSLNKVFLNVDEDNVAACRLYEKIGFKLEGKFEQDMLHHGVFINRLRYAMLIKNFKGEY